MLWSERHSWTHPEGWRDWPYEAPATSRMRERCQFLRDVAEAFRNLRHERFRRRFLIHGSHQADLQGVRRGLCARGALRVRPLLRPARGRLRARHRRRRSRPPAHPGRPAEHLALSRLPAVGGPAAAHADRPARRLHAADPRRPAGRAPGDPRGVGQERRRQPHPLVQGPRRLGGQHPCARAGLRRRWPAPRPATWPTRLPPTAPRWACDATSSSPPTSRSRRSSPPASTARAWSRSRATTTTSTGCAPSSAASATGPSSTSTCGRTTQRAPRRWPTRSPSSSDGRRRTAWSRRSPRVRCTRRSPGASTSGASSAWCAARRRS